MYRFNKKIAAFTLTEVIITLAITGVVVILSYSTYQMLQLYFNKVEKNNAENIERLGLRYFMSRDVAECDSLQFYEGTLFMYTDTMQVQWVSAPDTLIRNSSGIRREFFIPGNFLSAVISPETQMVNQVQLYHGGLTDDTLIFYKHYPLDIILNK